MRFILILFILSSFSISALAQGPCKTKRKTSKQFNVEIQVNYTAFYQGGVEQEEKELVPAPLANAELILVRWKGADEKPEKIQRLKSDENGRIEIKLEAGNYGLVAVDDKLEKGQYMPQTVYNGNEFESNTSAWEISTKGPIEISSETKVVLVNHRRSICYLCP